MSTTVLAAQMSTFVLPSRLRRHPRTPPPWRRARGRAGSSWWQCRCGQRSASARAGQHAAGRPPAAPAAAAETRPPEGRNGNAAGARQGCAWTEAAYVHRPLATARPTLASRAVLSVSFVSVRLRTLAMAFSSSRSRLRTSSLEVSNWAAQASGQRVAYVRAALLSRSTAQAKRAGPVAAGASPRHHAGQSLHTQRRTRPHPGDCASCWSVGRMSMHMCVSAAPAVSLRGTTTHPLDKRDMWLLVSFTASSSKEKWRPDWLSLCSDCAEGCVWSRWEEGRAAV